MKICSKCNVEKSLDNFYKAKVNKDNLCSWCKDCDKLKQKKYRKSNAEIVSAKRRKKYLDSREKVLEQCKKYKDEHKKEYQQYYLNNKEIINMRTRKYSIQYRIDNKELIKQKQKEYVAQNRESITKKHLEKLHNNTNYKLGCYLRTRLHNAMKNNKKIGSAIQDLGCSIKELKIWLEQQFYSHPKTGEIMSWENYGKYGWHIDHIYPLSKVDLTDKKQLKKVCHWFNLRPMWAEENISKNNKLSFGETNE